MIEVKNLTKYYGEICAVDDMSFSIRKGEITGLLGPNGAGKTTTMRIITGYLLKTHGEINVEAFDIETDILKIKEMIGYLPESAPLYNDMIVWDYLKFVASLRNIADEDRIIRTATTCGILEVMGRKIEELSKGYRQRVGLAQAMVHDPEILILDEPTSGLDPNQILEVRRLIKEIGKEKTIIISTHILQEVEALCDRVIIVNRGKIIADDDIAVLKSMSRKRESIRIAVKGPEFDELKETCEKKISGCTCSVQKGEEGLATAAVAVGQGEEIRPLIVEMVREKGWILYELTREISTLEKVFHDLTLGGSDE